MTIFDIHQLMKRDLALFIEELEKFPEDRLFVSLDGITNSGGTLGLHLAGNVRHYIGAGLGNSGYVRDREQEFSARDIPKQTILMNLKNAAGILDQTLSQMTNDRLKDPYPDLKPWSGLTIGFVLGQLLAHLNYHLGQLNYLRRILSQQKQETFAKW